MKKLILAAGLLGMIWGGGAIAKPADCATVSDPWNHANCERDCGKDSSLDWCDDICTEEPNEGHSWCASASSDSWSCDNKDSYTYVAVDPASEAQAKMIMASHCASTDPADIQQMFMDLTEEDVVGVICHYDPAATYCSN